MRVRVRVRVRLTCWWIRSAGAGGCRGGAQRRASRLVRVRVRARFRVRVRIRVGLGLELGLEKSVSPPPAIARSKAAGMEPSTSAAVAGHAAQPTHRRCEPKSGSSRHSPLATREPSCTARPPTALVAPG